MPVLSGFSRADEVELDATPVCPLLERLGSELSAVVNGDRDRRTRLLDRAIEHVRDVLAAEGEPWLKQRTLTTKLIDDGEHPKRLSVEQLVMDKIHAPALVGALRLGHRAAMQAHVLAATRAHAYLQALEPIPPIDPLVHGPSFASQHHVDA